VTKGRGGAETIAVMADSDIRPDDLRGVFAVPQWLRDLGLTAWLLVGLAVLVVGSLWLAARIR
jgi:hypothetical protein